jgi:hypothetical protein
MVHVDLIKSESNTSESLLEIAEILVEALTDIRNELAEIRGYKDTYVLNASDAIRCFEVWSTKSRE